MVNVKKAQSTLEYIIVFTAIVAAIVIAANSFIKNSINSSLNHTANEMSAAVGHINFTD